MFFSIAHGVVLEDEFRHHCTVQEYVNEFDHSIQQHDEHKGDCCKTHFLFHLSFLLPDTPSFFKHITLSSSIEYHLHLNDTLYFNNTFRPPIA